MSINIRFHRIYYVLQITNNFILSKLFNDYNYWTHILFNTVQCQVLIILVIKHCLLSVNTTFISDLGSIFLYKRLCVYVCARWLVLQQVRSAQTISTASRNSIPLWNVYPSRSAHQNTLFGIVVMMGCRHVAYQMPYVRVNLCVCGGCLCVKAPSRRCVGDTRIRYCVQGERGALGVRGALQIRQVRRLNKRERDRWRDNIMLMCAIHRQRGMFVVCECMCVSQAAYMYRIDVCMCVCNTLALTSLMLCPMRLCVCVCSHILCQQIRHSRPNVFSVRVMCVCVCQRTFISRTRLCVRSAYIGDGFKIYTRRHACDQSNVNERLNSRGSPTNRERTREIRKDSVFMCYCVRVTERS